MAAWLWAVSGAWAGSPSDADLAWPARAVSRAVIGADGVWRWVESPEDVAVAIAEGEAAAERARDPLRFDLLDLASIDIPIDLNDAVREWVEHYVGPGRKSFARWLARGARFQPMMRRELAAAGLPLDLMYIPLIESGYDPLARSKTSAMGLWQFVGSTGSAQGLRIDAWADERLDPERSLHAAIDYLAGLHGQFGDWRLAWAAYNAGPGAVERAIHRTRTRSYWKLVARGQFSAETDEYVAKIMAAAIIGEHPDWYGFGNVALQAELAYDVVQVADSVSFATLAAGTGVSATDLRALNPALRRGATPPAGWALRVPPGTADRFAQWAPVEEPEQVAAN